MTFHECILVYCSLFDRTADLEADFLRGANRTCSSGQFPWIGPTNKHARKLTQETWVSNKDLFAFFELRDVGF